MTFEKWMEQVDDAVAAKTGMSYMDLPDVEYYFMFEDETPASEAARIALETAGWRGA